MDANSHPQVRSYLDANQFLQDVYRYRKDKQPDGNKFSYDIWAQQMGLTSKSYLRFAILGQRKISSMLAQKISDFLKFNDLDKEYFSLLVLFTQCQQKDQKTILGRRLTQLLRSEVTMTEIAPSQSLLGNPLMLAVRNLLSFSDIPRTPDFLQKILRVSSEELKDILATLTRENLISQKGNEWIANDHDIKISDKDQRETLLYHKQCLLKAIEAQAKPVHERHFRSIGIAMTAEEYAKYLQHLDQFIQSIFANFNCDSFAQKRLYQVNFNLYPWTEQH